MLFEVLITYMQVIYDSIPCTCSPAHCDAAPDALQGLIVQFISPEQLTCPVVLLQQDRTDRQVGR
jgi:hypothetical protein